MAEAGFIFWATVLFGYLLGAIPFSLLAGWWRGIDVRRTGSRNPGAGNVFQSVGKRVGVAVALLDAAKGAVPVVIGLSLGLTPLQAIWPGAAAVIGHDFPVYLRFRGGKGGATTLGFLACFIFPELLVVLGFWLVLWMVVHRYRFLASIFALSLTPAWVALFGWSWPVRLEPITPIAWVSLALMALLWVRVLPGVLAGARRS